MNKIAYAHSLPGKPPEQWQLLEEHLKAVAEKAGEFAATFGLSDGIQFDLYRESGHPALIHSGLLFIYD